MGFNLGRGGWSFGFRDLGCRGIPKIMSALGLFLI